MKNKHNAFTDTVVALSFRRKAGTGWSHLIQIKKFSFERRPCRQFFITCAVRRKTGTRWPHLIQIKIWPLSVGHVGSSLLLLQLDAKRHQMISFDTNKKLAFERRPCRQFFITWTKCNKPKYCIMNGASKQTLLVISGWWKQYVQMVDVNNTM